MSNRRRRVVSLFLSALVLLVCFSFANTAKAANLSGASSWAIPELTEADGYGLLTDAYAGNYAKPVTRLEFVKIYMKAYAVLYGTPLLPSDFVNPYTDTSDPTVLKATYIGFVNGDGKGHFKPDSTLSRAELATLLAMFANGGTMPAADPAISYSDLPASHWAVGAICYATKAQLMVGTTNNRFLPDTGVTLEQSVAVMVRFIKGLL